MQQSERNLVARIDEALVLANKLCFVGEIVSDREKAALRKWMTRWRDIRARLHRDNIDGPR